MTAPVVVFAVGNPSRGDDALGPHLLARLEEWLQAEGRAGEVDLVEDFQLNIEHALDLEGRNLALFIDAGTGMATPCSFARVVPAVDLGVSTHALEPGAVLRVHGQACQTQAPACFVLVVRGECFELGESLSPVARNSADIAWALLLDLLSQPRLEHWERAWTEG